MNIIRKIYLKNFKSYDDLQNIDLSDLSVLIGANSSGKSTVIQALLAIKQTIESNSKNIQFLLNGKYVSLGDFFDVTNKSDDELIIGVVVDNENDTDKNELVHIEWHFCKSEDNNKKAELCKISIKISMNQVDFIKENNEYFLYYNNKKSIYSVDIFHLLICEINLNYSQQFNDKFYELFKELYFAMFNSNKVFEKEFASIDGSSEFFRVSLDKYIDKPTRNPNLEISKQCEKIFNLIQDYSCAQNGFLDTEFKFLENYKYLFGHFFEDTKKIDTIIKKYRAYYDEYRRSDKFVFDKKKVVGHELFYYEMNNDNTNNFSEYFSCYSNLCTLLKECVFYLGPIREKPNGFYQIGFESIPKYVGFTGSYFPSVLLNENEKVDYIYPKGCIEKSSLNDSLAAWVKHLEIANSISVNEDFSYGNKVIVKNISDVGSDIQNVGVGTSQVLPVLIMGLVSRHGETLIFEQPELHLHPYSQSRLADFFISLAKNGRKLIIETHSEYMMLRFRYHIITGNVNENSIIVNFFQNKGASTVKNSLIDEFGEIEYPSDFKDETQTLINELLNAVLAKK